MTMSQIFGEAEGAGGDEPAPMMEELPASAVPGGAADSPGYSPTTEPGDPDSVPMLLPPQQLQVIPETIEEDQTMPTPVPEDAGEMSRQTTAAEPEPHPTTNSATATPRFQPTFNTQSNQPSFVQQQPSSFPQFGGPGEAALPLPPNFIPLQHPPNLYNQLNTALARDPELLDGHGPTRYRDLRNRDIREGRVNGPYLAEEEPWEEMCPGLEDSVRMLRLREIVDIEEESTGDEATDEDGRENGNPVIAEAFLTGKAIRSEIRLGDLGPGQRSLFDEAMKKEWSSWMKFSTVEVMTPDQIAELPEDTKIIGTRWVHVDKNNKRRLIAKMLAKKTGKTQEQIDRENPLEAKSRIVVQGCQEEETGIRSDSPTASLLAFNLVSAIAVMNKWEVRSYDASTAYLQAKGIDRLLILKPPKPPPPGVSSTDLLRAKGSIYGTKDAGRSWWFKLLEESKKEGWIQSSIEPALFYLYEGGELCGIMISHVDDLYTAGEGNYFEEAMKRLTKKIHLKEQKGEFKFCGKHIVQQKDGQISIDQTESIETIEYQVIDRSRRSKPGAPLTEDEKSGFRALIGSMGWVTRQSRPDIMVNVSIAAQALGKPTVKDVIDLNKALKMLKETPNAKWNYVPSSITMKNCAVFVCADSSFANLPGHKSQCGYVVGLSLPSLENGEETPVLLLETCSSSIKRVCRSTLAAEANGFLAGVEAADYVRMILLEIENPGISIRNLDKEFPRKRLLAFTDAKSLESTVNKDAGQPSDKRVKILVAQVKELLSSTPSTESAAGISVHWVDTSQMLADVLTKVGCERELLLEVLEKGTWTLLATEAAAARKEKIRADRRQRKAKSKATEDG